MEALSQRVERFLFPAKSDKWLTLLRLGLGTQVTVYSLSLRTDWNHFFRGNGNGVISRDLSEAILTAQGPLLPRIGWLVKIGAALGVNEETVLSVTWSLLLCAGCLLLIGFLSRGAAVSAWFLHLCAAKSG